MLKKKNGRSIILILQLTKNQITFKIIISKFAISYFFNNHKINQNTIYEMLYFMDWVLEFQRKLTCS